MQIRLRPIHPDEWDDFYRLARDGYSDQLASVPGFDDAAARSKAEEDSRRLLGDGIESPGQHVFMIEGPDAEILGSVWFAEQEFHGTRFAYLYNIEVHEEHRDAGIGAQAMKSLEEEVRQLDLAWIDLNVLGGNARARHVYTKLGYDETFVSMRRILGPAASAE